LAHWIVRGIQTEIKTTRYPDAQELAAGATPGFPSRSELAADWSAALVDVCPTGALRQVGGGVDIDNRLCVHCYRCVRSVEHPIGWQQTYEWATCGAAPDTPTSRLGAAFARSANIIVVDAGDCGACLNEVRQLNNPYYNMHRLGFFITPTPRNADILLVVGPVTDHLREMLLKVYDAMPAPKRVIAVGTCALSGGVFAESFVCAKGVAEVLPVDVEVPGSPPPPLAILHGLLVAVGRKPAAEA
jgi:Ni,Fe-hydrogenase III small subunit/ferredoxin-like protein FixX